ncbi:hypothetical protein ACEPAF_6773 [Sanghuangporus sanghuang]
MSSSFSVVRKILDLQFIGETHEEEQLFTADVDLKGLEGYIGLSGHGVAEIVQEWTDVGHEEFQSILRNFTKCNDSDLSKIHAKLVWKYNSRMVDHFQKGRVFVAGDAAHAHSPMGRQEMTSSIQDSFNLAWKLALIVKGYASPTLLTSYEEEHLLCISDMLLKSSKLHRLVYNEKGVTSSNTEPGKENNAIAQKTIDALGSAAASVNKPEILPKPKALPARPQLSLESDCVRRVQNCRVCSPDSKEKDAYGKPGCDLRAGDHALDGPGLVVLHKASLPVGKIATQDVLKILSEGLIRTVLIVPQDASSSAVGKDVDLFLADKEGHAYKGYGIEKDVNIVMIVRTDAMVGAVAVSSAGVEWYLTKVFAVATA